jgi:hypothetical protein
MSDAIPLPPRPDVDQYRTLAKDAKDALPSDVEFDRFARRWMRRLAELLQDPDERHVDAYVEKLRRAAAEYRAERPTPALTDAQLFLARVHEFPSWPRFVDHLQHLANASSDVARFEAAADAIVRGDVAELRRLLAEDPGLVRARSTRDHRSTLLHYVSANGVEDWRQRTPPNVVEVARVLLDAGAEVDAESDAYAGRSTTLMLAATSVHPEAAGVQAALLDLLLARGARIDGPEPGMLTVNACLANGRHAAAQHLAARGATLDLEGAAGVGRLDLVRSSFDAATQEKRVDALAWASEYGHADVVGSLLDHGVPLDSKLRNHGQSALHWAAYGGHVELVRLLLARGADPNLREAHYEGTPLDWALYAWGGEGRGTPVYYAVVALLARAGARLESGWDAPDRERSQARRRLLSDARMMAALQGEA